MTLASIYKWRCRKVYNIKKINTANTDPVDN